MKLSKKSSSATAKPVKANTLVIQEVASPDATALAEVSANKYGAAICHITAAIESLGAIAKDDELAKDSIANLSVVLLDLK